MDQCSPELEGGWTTGWRRLLLRLDSFLRKSVRITPEYKEALAEHGPRAYYGDDASVQPGSLQEVLLHEKSKSTHDMPASIHWLKQ